MLELTDITDSNCETGKREISGSTDLSDYKIIFTWGNEDGRVPFFKADQYFISEQCRAMGDDHVSVAVPVGGRSMELFSLLDDLDLSSENVTDDRWLLVGSLVDTPTDLRNAGILANKLFVVDVDDMIELLPQFKSPKS